MKSIVKNVFDFRGDESAETSDLLTPPQSPNARPEKTEDTSTDPWWQTF